MNQFTYKLVIFCCILGFTSCDFLDIVPDETATEEDAFKNPKAAERYLYSCYSYIPDPRSGSACLDLFTGDEVVTPWEHETFGKFAQGNYTPSNPYINYWHDLYKGIRQCYLFRDGVESVPGLNPTDKEYYKAEADFLIAYYHFYLLRTYGPSILIKELVNVNNIGDASTFLPRQPYDECVKWVADQLKEVSSRLPARWFGTDYGRATATAALAIRARLLLYAASPQFNGGDKFKNIYSEFKNKDGQQLISTAYNPQKWIDAAQAYKEAINFAEENNYTLYIAKAGSLPNLPEPSDLTMRSLRLTFIDKDNSEEVIWGYAGHEGGSYGLQGKTVPRWGQFSWGGVAPSLLQIERFYTKNGLPINIDPEFDYQNRFDVASFNENSALGEGPTVKINMEREPRFYSWIAFHNGYYEVQGEDKTANSINSYATKYKRGINNSMQVVQFTKLSNMGLTSGNTQGTKTGYLNKKGANPGTSVTSDGLKLSEYPWPVVRLGELYLSYAEALVECGDLVEAKRYLNLVRARAGIPSVEESWSKVGITLDQDQLRSIVRQERSIELYLENHNFWDLRRWGIAETLGEQPLGMSVKEQDLSLFAKPATVDVQRRFVPAQYLMPLPISEVNKNPNLVQNPGYADVQ